MRARPGSGSPSVPWRSPRVVAAWVAVVAWGGVVWWLGSGSFGAPATSRYLIPFLHWLLPDASGTELWRIALAVRELAHPTVYGVLAALAYHAMRVTGVSPPWRAAGGAFVLVLFVAALDEARQATLVERTGALTDVMLDSGGALVVLGLLLWASRLRGHTPLGGT